MNAPSPTPRTQAPLGLAWLADDPEPQAPPNPPAAAARAHAAMPARPGVVHALNLADTLGAHNIGHALDDLVASGGYRRVYLGSYFCGRYFCAQPLGVFIRALAFCAARGIPVTLVVPIPAERELDAVTERVETLVASHGHVIDEITCNDLGMLAFCTARFDLALNAGRLFNRDVREPREPGFAQLPGRPALATRAVGDAFPGCRVNGYEFDPVHQVCDLSGAPRDRTYALHADWCYATTGKICEAASIGAPVSRKFRPSAPCSCPCLHHVLEHRPANPSAPTYYKHGRTVYYRQPDARIEGPASWRLVHPVLLAEGCERP